MRLSLAYSLVLISCSSPSSIEGEVRIIHLTEVDERVVPTDLSSVTLQAFVRDTSGEYRVVVGVGETDGTFIIDDVPEGTYLLEIGGENSYSEYFVTADRDPVFETKRVGREDVVRSSGSGTELRLDLNGLAPWQNDDDLAVWSIGSATGFGGIVSFPQLLPSVGMTMLDVVVPYNDRGRLVNEPLIEGRRGDIAYVSQSRFRESGGVSTREIVAILKSESLNQVNGQSATFEGTMSSVENEISLLPNPWGLLGSELPSEAPLDGFRATSRLVASPRADLHGIVGGVLLASHVVADAVTAETIAAQYPPIYPTEWIWMAVDITYQIDLLHAGFSHLVPAQCGVRGPVGTELTDAVIGAPTELSIPSALDGDAAEALIRWEAPRRGVATSYSLDVLRLQCVDSFGCFGELVARIVTAETEVVVPRLLLPAGAYALRVVASSRNTEGALTSFSSTVGGPMQVF